MNRKIADFKRDEVKIDTINICFICGSKFLANCLLISPVCPDCMRPGAKKRIKKVK